ncbi:hypothetical protein JCM5353_000664 [Sporobolomyces roseus]
MSSSSSTDSLGDCVVCGTRTPTRCSECASNGTKWMYFCSREHQKLIYKTHKRVCGKRSSPLRWPELTEKEAKRYLELGSVLDPDSSGKTFAEMATPYKLPSRTYAEGYKNLVDFAHEPYGIRGEGWDIAKFQNLAMLRSQVHAFKSSRIDNVDMDTVVPSKEFDDMFDDAAEVDTFDLLLNSVDAGWPELCTKPFDAAWWEPLMHRCIIAFTFLAIRMSGAPNTEEEELEEEARNKRNSPFLRYTYSEVMKLLRDEVARKHVAEAKDLESALAWFFSEDVINPSYDKRDQERMRKAVI